MTREEGKEFANALKNNYTIDFDKMPDFCDLVISALSAKPCEDCISREATVKRLCKVAEFMNEKRDNLGAPYIMAALFIQDNKEVFPSVQPIIPNMTIPADDSYMRNVRRDCGLYE